MTGGLDREIQAWAVEVTGSPLDGGRRHLVGQPEHPLGPRLFRSRAAARAFLRGYKREAAWAFGGPWAMHGGTRIYRSARVVPVRVALEVLA